MMQKDIWTKVLVIGIILLFVGTSLAPSIRGDTPWSQTQKLVASDGVSEDHFGMSVSLYDNTALIGAENEDNGAGAAYVFILDGNTWTQQAKLIASDAQNGDMFGTSVSLYGDTALIGAYHDDGDIGSAYVFTRTGSTWTEQAKLTASDETNLFGCSVSVYGDTALIGAYNSNAAYIFSRIGSAWTQEAKLIPDVGGSQFGCSVSVYEDTALIGAQGDNSAFVFIRASGDWSEQAKLVPTNGPNQNYFGTSVSLYGDTALIGAHDIYSSWQGSAFVFTRTGVIWTQQAKLTASDGALFGYSVSLYDNTALISGYYWNDYTGNAYVFTQNGEVWTQEAELHASDQTDMNCFGHSVSLYQDDILIGAYGNNGNTGAVYVFKKGGGNQPPTADFNFYPVNPEAGEQIIFNASISNDPDGYIILYEWDWNGDGIFDECNIQPKDVFWWNEIGTFKVGLRVTDNKLTSTTVYKEITIGSVARKFIPPLLAHAIP